LRWQPLHHFIQGAKRQIYDRLAANVDILTQRGQKGRPHGLDRVAARGDGRDRELAFVVGVNDGENTEVRPQQLHNRADLWNSGGVTHHA
jgi:hypothetical protein